MEASQPVRSKASGKKEAIIVRVETSMKDQIMSLAEKSRRDLSDYLRLILEDTIKNQVRV